MLPLQDTGSLHGRPQGTQGQVHHDQCQGDVRHPVIDVSGANMQACEDNNANPCRFSLASDGRI
jgi:hypothetical protein